MSTEIELKGDFYLRRFFGGNDRGMCFQITQTNGPNIWLRQKDAKELAEAILNNLMGTGEATDGRG